MELQGKVAIVTGAGTGVGRATALALGRRGCSVLVDYSRSKDEAERTAAEVQALGVRALPVQADVARDDDCRRLVDTAIRELGRLDVLVNNAGQTVFVPHADLEGIRDEDWTRVLGVNLIGPFQMCRAARGPLEASGAGSIVNVSSVAGLAGIGSSIPYCTSKAGMNILTVILARALAPRIRVNAVAPGFITGRWLAQGLGPAYGPVKKAMEERAPLKRVCEPEDVAAAILGFVAGSELVTGQILAVDGGMLIAG